MKLNYKPHSLHKVATCFTDYILVSQLAVLKMETFTIFLFTQDVPYRVLLAPINVSECVSKLL